MSNATDGPGDEDERAEMRLPVGDDSGQHEQAADDDVVTDPHLDDPRDDDAPEEGVSSDWTAEGGAMPEGPATDAG